MLHTYMRRPKIKLTFCTKDCLCDVHASKRVFVDRTRGNQMQARSVEMFSGISIDDVTVICDDGRSMLMLALRLQT